MRVVDEMSYTPNSAARMLKTRKTGTLGYLYNRDRAFNEQILASGLFEAIEVEAQDCGYHIAIASVPHERGRASLPIMIEQHRVDGVFLRGEMDDELITSIEKAGMPLVLLGNYRRDRDIECVIADDIGGAYRAARHLLDIGHTRIGFIGAPMGNMWSWERLQGLRLGLDERNLPLKEQWISTDDLWSGREGFLRMMDLEDKPTAIFCANDRFARTAMETAREKGLSIPEDISLVGFDNDPWTAKSNPPLTTVDTFPELIGKAAVKKMQTLVEGERTPWRAVTPAKLIIRNSTCPPSGGQHDERKE